MIEDETEIRELISLLLLRQGHRVQQCSTAVEGLEQMKKGHFDLVVLDWMLPQMNGLEFLRVMPNPSSIPVLMVTAKAEPKDICEGLEAGADDYLTKPFEPSVLTARVRALLRRSQRQPNESSDGEPAEVLQIGGITLNLAAYEVKIHGEPVHLTPSEFKILSEMMGSTGRVLTRDHLIEVVQGEGISVTGRTVDTHVFGLRKKLGSEADWIETIRGVGYRIRAE
ncbi:MAG: DNA-binding response regulator [Bdellovibrio sp.]|nr:MAG: DNA-binding response regulator [Bdellovibrio sp.]